MEESPGLDESVVILSTAVRFFGGAYTQPNASARGPSLQPRRVFRSPEYKG